MLAPQYRVYCPQCHNGQTINRTEPITTGFLWWKKQKFVPNQGRAQCKQCKYKFSYDMNLNQLSNCYPTALGIHPHDLLTKPQTLQTNINPKESP